MNTFWKQSYSSTASKKHPEINDFHSFSHPFVSKAIQAQVQNSVQKTTISVVFRIRFWAKLYKHRFKTTSKNRRFFFVCCIRFWAKLYKHMITPASKNQWFSLFFESVSKQCIQAPIQNSVQKPMIFVAFRTRFSPKLYKHRFKTASKNQRLSSFYAPVSEQSYTSTGSNQHPKTDYFRCFFEPVSEQRYTSTGSKQRPKADDFRRFSHPFLSKAIQAQVQNRFPKPTSFPLAGSPDRGEFAVFWARFFTLHRRAMVHLWSILGATDATCLLAACCCCCQTMIFIDFGSF